MSSSENASLFKRLKYTLLGAPIPTSKAHHERLGILTGLPVFASDNLSSSAYANEAILGVLVLFSAGLAGLQIWLSLSIAVLIAIVAWSYKQTIYAYPNGGGSYIVASSNLGEKPGLIAGSALMIDYVLTVAVSVAAGVAAIVSAFPSLHSWLVPISFACIVVIAFGNLRGVRESGAVFSIPTYGFLASMALLMVFGVAKALASPAVHQTILSEPGMIGKEAALPMLFVVLRAFAAGCTALTGIEAVSNGVQAFRDPAPRNASRTLLIMASILTALFIGIGFITLRMPTIELYATKNPQYTTLVSQIAAWTFGGSHSFGFYFVQFATAGILVLAANTAFQDFPRLSSMLARDGFLPRPLARQGDRLVFQNGIILLSVASALLVWAYHGELDQLLPLYAVGVFMAFTLSQAGMVVHWHRLKEKGHGFSMLINGFGAVVTGIVTIVLFATKFSEGAWMIAVVTLLFYAAFRAVKKRYSSINAQLFSGRRTARPLEGHTAILLVGRTHRGTIKAMDYALSLHGGCRAVHVALNEKAVPEILAEWEKIAPGIPLIVLASPYRSLIDPVLEYVDEIRAEKPDEVITVIVPEAIPTRWYHRFLQENLAFQLKFALGARRNVVVTNVRYFLE